MRKEAQRIEAIKRDAFEYIDRNKGEITKIGDAIFYFAERGMQEFRTSEIIQKNIEMAGIPQWSRDEEVLAKEVQKKMSLPVVGLHKEIVPLKWKSGVRGRANLCYLMSNRRL